MSSKRVIIISGSPRKDGNTSLLIDWFSQGAASAGAQIEVIWAAFLKYKAPGCTSCRACQKAAGYGCVIDDDAQAVLKKMLAADVIVMATPLYFFSMSAQIKIIFDRMFSLYKWDNQSGAMETPLKGKSFILLASAFEKAGLDALEKPFALTADYTEMIFHSLLVPDAGVSGDIKNKTAIKEKAILLGKKVG